MTNKSQIAISNFQTFGIYFLDFGTYLIFGTWDLCFVPKEFLRKNLRFFITFDLVSKNMRAIPVNIVNLLKSKRIPEFFSLSSVMPQFYCGISKPACLF